MRYEAGENRLQYRCKNCGLVSPHNKPCFRCGCVEKLRSIVPEIVRKAGKGQGINIGVR